MTEIEKFSNYIESLANEVYENLGDGFSEDIYQQALAYELRKNNVDYLRETQIELYYKDQIVGRGLIDFYFPEQNRKKFSLSKPIIIETKYTTALKDEARAQLKHYLMSTKLNKSTLLRKVDTGLLLNWTKKVDYNQIRINPEIPIEIEIWKLSKDSKNFKKQN